jgi:hypothetical protein
MAVVSLCIGALVIVAGIDLHFGPVSFIILALCAYFPFGWLILDRLAVRRRYHRNQNKFIDHTVTFNDESVSTTSTMVDLRVTWDQLACVVSTPRGLLFLTPPHHIWFWLPQRLFEDNNHRDTILKLASKHKIPIRRMT